MRVVTAIRALLRVLFDREFAGQVDTILTRTSSGDASHPQPAATAPGPQVQTRSEAISLLAALQRDARLVDFLQEPLEGYSDVQIGAAARDVHRECRNVIERMFALQPLLAAPEGAAVEVPRGYDAACYRVTGNVAGEPPFRGNVVHHGWKATICQVPKWSGGKDASLVVAPAEVELK